MSGSRLSLFVLLFGLLAPAVLHAQEAEEQQVEQQQVEEQQATEQEGVAQEVKPEPREHRVYVSFSPVHLILPFVELTGEFRLANKFGIAAILGAGHTSNVTTFDIGAQGIWYPIGSFNHGMQLGAEALYTGGGATTSFGGQSASATAGIFSIGPFIGYKLATDIGFSFCVQVGAAYYAGGASGSSTDGASVSVAGSGVMPLLNLQLGWSL